MGLVSIHKTSPDQDLQEGVAVLVALAAYLSPVEQAGYAEVNMAFTPQVPRSALVQQLLLNSARPRPVPRSAIEGAGQGINSILSAVIAKKLQGKANKDFEAESSAFRDSILGTLQDNPDFATAQTGVNSAVLGNALNPVDTGSLNLGASANNVLGGVASAQNALANTPEQTRQGGIINDPKMAAIIANLSNSPEGLKFAQSALAQQAFETPKPVTTERGATGAEIQQMKDQGILDPAFKGSVILEMTDGRQTGFKLDELAGPLVRIGDEKESPTITRLRNSFFENNFDPIQVSAKLSREKLGALRELATLVESGVSTGPFAQFTLGARKVLQEVTGISLGDVDAQQAIEAIGIKFTVDELQRLTGPKSDFEFKTLERSVPGLAKTTEGNKLIIEMSERAIQASLIAQDASLRWLSANQALVDGDPAKATRAHNQFVQDEIDASGVLSREVLDDFQAQADAILSGPPNPLEGLSIEELEAIRDGR